MLEMTAREKYLNYAGGYFETRHPEWVEELPELCRYQAVVDVGRLDNVDLTFRRSHPRLVQER